MFCIATIFVKYCSTTVCRWLLTGRGKSLRNETILWCLNIPCLSRLRNILCFNMNWYFCVVNMLSAFFGLFVCLSFVCFCVLNVYYIYMVYKQCCFCWWYRTKLRTTIGRPSKELVFVCYIFITFTWYEKCCVHCGSGAKLPLRVDRQSMLEKNVSACWT